MSDLFGPWGSELLDQLELPAPYAARIAQVLLQLRRGTGYMDEHWACAAAGHVESGWIDVQIGAGQIRTVSRTIPSWLM